MSDSIEITVNGVRCEINHHSMIVDYLQQHKIEGRFLVMVNDEVLPKSAYQFTALKFGDRLDIISPISGG